MPRGDIQETSTSWRTPAGPALTAHNNRLVLAHTGADGKVSAAEGQATSTGTSWSSNATLTGSSAAGDVSLASHDGKLHLVYRLHG